MRGGDDDDSWRSILNQALSEEYDPSQSDVKPPSYLLAAGIGTALAINFGILAFSLPSVLRGRGAPYLPTWERNLDIMFKEHLNGVNVTRLTFADLGSGDGRVVRRAAHEGFGLSIGYEINPLLHLWAKMRQSPRTELYCANLWDVSLGKVDVVAVYGLGPIMKELGAKLETELRPGSIVLSNVFAFPGWRATSSRQNVHMYRVPGCWKGKPSST